MHVIYLMAHNVTKSTNPFKQSTIIIIIIIYFMSSSTGGGGGGGETRGTVKRLSSVLLYVQHTPLRVGTTITTHNK